MDILLAVYHDDKVDFQITKHNIKAFLLDLLVAGISGADEAVKWAIAELINHPDVFIDGHEAKLKLESGTGMSLSLPQQLLCRPVVHFNPFA
ncbi:hypothetical protein Pint_24045 [Pistacia integerrima]|uniref:Uncharacterized protein n=1 Tax=Pistacia integerrima TaxID=434235 RepID=A0ACC0YLU8_9ROSI|nr:hypothetical protein Pint_24045 [Pistacia integerrima]